MSRFKIKRVSRERQMRVKAAMTFACIVAGLAVWMDLGRGLEVLGARAVLPEWRNPSGTPMLRTLDRRLAGKLGDGMVVGVATVLSADRIRVDGSELHLAGILGFNHYRHCQRDDGIACGASGADVLRQWLGGAEVACRLLGSSMEDGTLMASCETAGGQSLSHEIVSQGFAESMDRTNVGLIMAETGARRGRRGYWATQP